MILTDTKNENQENWYFPSTDTYVVMHLECHEKSVRGEFRHLYVQESEPFNSISEFIYKLELMLEQINVPQAATSCRKGWSIPNRYKYGEDENAPAKEWKFSKEPFMITGKKTGLFFLIHIRYRYNSSWQGEIRWLKGKNTMVFRSVLELLMVLENTILQQVEGFQNGEPESRQ